MKYGDGSAGKNIKYFIEVDLSVKKKLSYIS